MKDVRGFKLKVGKQVCIQEDIPSVNGMLYKNSLVKVDEFNDKTKKIRVTDKLGKASGYRRFVTETMPDIEATLPGDEKSIEKLQIEDLKDGKYYLGPPKDQFITVKGGKIIKEESGLE